MLYFQSRRQRYRPPQNWYSKGSDLSWRRVSCDYHYLLVTQPYDRRMIKVATKSLAADETAELLEITAQPSC
jgi:hypothetical protein